MLASIGAILLRIFIVGAIWASVWHYVKPKNKASRVLRALILVIALLLATTLISLTT